MWSSFTYASGEVLEKLGVVRGGRGRTGESKGGWPPCGQHFEGWHGATTGG